MSYELYNLLHILGIVLVFMIYRVRQKGRAARYAEWLGEARKGGRE